MIPKKRGALACVRALEAIQIDPVARVGRNQDLVLWARDERYRLGDLDQLLERGEVFEYRANEASVLPMEHYPLFKGVRRRWQERLKPELDRYPDTAKRVIRSIQDRGPLSARAFDSQKKVMGYWDTALAGTKETSHVLNLLVDSGQLMVVKRDGALRYFDTADHAVPVHIWDQASQIDEEEADDNLFDKYVRAYGLIRGPHRRLGWSDQSLAIPRARLKSRLDQGRMISVAIDGVATPYYMLAEAQERLAAWESRRGFARPVRFLPPLDNLLWDRDRLMDLFQFHYRWEVYVPAHQRTFGIYAMPVLAGDRLVGRVDPELRRLDATLVIHKAQWETSAAISARLFQAVEEALEKWAKKLGAQRVVYEQPWSRNENGNQKTSGKSRAPSRMPYDF